MTQSQQQAKFILNVDELAVAMNADKQLLKTIGTICFRRCISNSFENDMLNPLEQNCIDRCTFKFN